jgi:hypothetical protein
MPQVASATNLTSGVDLNDATEALGWPTPSLRWRSRLDAERISLGMARERACLMVRAAENRVLLSGIER